MKVLTLDETIRKAEERLFYLQNLSTEHFSYGGVNNYPHNAIKEQKSIIKYLKELRNLWYD